MRPGRGVHDFPSLKRPRGWPACPVYPRFLSKLREVARIKEIWMDLRIQEANMCPEGRFPAGSSCCSTLPPHYRTHPTYLDVGTPQAIGFMRY